MPETTLGLVMLAITSVLGGVGWFCRALWNRLFADETGYVTRIVDKHIIFLTAIEQSVQGMADSQEKQADSISGLSKVVQDLGAAIDRLDSKVEKLNEQLEKP